MINYNLNSMTPYINEFEEIGEYLGILISDDEVWEWAKTCEELPLFENIYQNLLLNGICQKVKEEYNLDWSYFINGMDTHLTDHNLQSVKCLKDIKHFIN